MQLVRILSFISYRRLYKAGAGLALIAVIELFAGKGAVAQDSTYFKKTYRRFFNKYVKVDSAIIDRDSSKATTSHEFPVPVVGFSQERKLVIGLALIYAFYRNSYDFKALSSSLVVSGGLFHLDQIRYRFKPRIFGDKKQYREQEEVAYQHYTQNYYGIGNRTLDTSFANLRQLRISGSLDFQRRLSKKIFFGVRTQYQYDNIKDKTVHGGFPTSNLDFATKAGSTFWIGPTFIFDTRNFQNYADKGDYLRAQMLYSPRFFNISGRTIPQLSIDGRHYKRIGRRQVLAANLVGQLSLSDNIPYFFLNQLGGSQIMRGYYTGRFRDRNVIEVQMEYRYRFLPRIAAAVFAGTGQVYGIQPFDINHFKPDGGGGLRYFFDLASRSTIRIDYGVGQKISGEKRIGGFYVSVNEAF